MEKLDNRIKCPHCHCADWVTDVSYTDKEHYMVKNGFLKLECRNPIILANRQKKRQSEPIPDHAHHTHDYMMRLPMWFFGKCRCYDWWVHKDLLISGTLRYKLEYVS